MKKICGIYKITSPSGKIYIGCSNNIYKRWSRYRHPESIKKQTYIYNSLIKYGVENHTFEIIEECNREILFEKEIYWINKLDSNNRLIGLNLSAGGGILPKTGRKLTQEQKDKISKTLKGRTHTSERISNIKKSLECVVYTKETHLKRALGREKPCKEKDLYFIIVSS